MQNADVVVVGAGLSGLVAARELTHAGLDVSVLEARDRIGGRIHTVADVHGAPIEMGAAFVGPHQYAIRQLAEEFELELIPTWDSGVHWGEFAGHHCQWRGSTPRLSPTAMVSAGAALTRLNAMARTVSTEAPWAARRGQAWDSISVGEWLDGRRIGDEARGLLTASLRSIFAADTDDLSLLHVLMCIHSAGGFRKYMRSSGAQQARFAEGAYTLCARIADDLEHVPNLATPVRRIEQTNEGVDVIGEATTFRARFAVVAVPPALFAGISFVPDIPRGQRGVVESASSGTVLKYHLYYSQPFWRTAGCSGKSLSSSELVNATFDHSSTDGCGVLVAFVVGRHAEELLCRSPEERIDAVLDCLAARFGPEVREPMETYVHSWSEDEWASGCFAAYLPPKVWTERKTSMRAQHRRVYFAGTETATRYFGAMEGAVTAGRRAAAEIVADLERARKDVRGASRGIG